MPDDELTRERWLRQFNEMLNTKSLTLDPTLVDELKVCSPRRPLDDITSKCEVDTVSWVLVNRKGVGHGAFPTELLKILADEEDPDTLQAFHYHCRFVEMGGLLGDGRITCFAILLVERSLETIDAIIFVVDAGKVFLTDITGRLCDYALRLGNRPARGAM